MKWSKIKDTSTHPGHLNSSVVVLSAPVPPAFHTLDSNRQA